SIPGGRHNGLVDGHYVYLVGGNPSGLVIYSILDPANPDSVNVYSPYYYHDVAIRNDTLAACAIGGQGIDILDLTDKSNIQLIGQFNYPGSGAHNAAFSEDGDFLFIGDEIGSGNYTRVFDISNLSNINKVADIIVNPNTVTHNSYVKDGHLFIAHYVDGLRVWNVEDPTDPYETAFYDTHLQTPLGPYEGAWGVYPYFESGKVIVSDMQTGLYVFNTSVPGESCCVGNRGDINGDGDPVITVADLTYLINFIFRGGQAPFCEEASDVNADNNTATVLDLTFIIDRIFRGGPAPSSCP
ncbi:MAG: choice-of-anchor B family protein, partial [candidate division Zixibacteria bacterium]|nr:choice-of-anchor B family protein [candidate division Zixibacteria bacterium]